MASTDVETPWTYEYHRVFSEMVGFVARQVRHRSFCNGANPQNAALGQKMLFVDGYQLHPGPSGLFAKVAARLSGDRRAAIYPFHRMYTGADCQVIWVKEGDMAVKVLIKRQVPEGKAKEVIPLFRELRGLAMEQDGYISGETLRRLEKPEEYLVISTWHSSEDWEKWMAAPQRDVLQSRLDSLLGGKTEYEVYHYGFSE